MRIILSLFFLCATFPLHAGDLSLVGTTDKEQALYKAGEKMTFTITALEDGKPVEYENVIIFGDLDLSRLDLAFNKNNRKIIKSIIKIEYSVIKGDVFFDRSVFTKLVDFDGGTFNKAADFSDSLFMEDAGLSSAQFQEEAKFSRANFKTEANFSRAKFDGDAEFGNARFHKHLNLDSAKIYTMRLSDAAFEDGSSLNLTDLDFNRIVVRWETIKNHFPYNGSV